MGNLGSDTFGLLHVSGLYIKIIKSQTTNIFRIEYNYNFKTSKTRKKKHFLPILLVNKGPVSLS